MIKQAAQAVDDREPKAKAAATVLAGGRELVELTEDIALLILGNADAAVADFESQEAVTAATADHDSADRRITHGIRYQIEEDSLEQNEIAADPGAVRYDPQAQILFSCGSGERHLDPLEQLIDREVRDAGSEHAGIEPGNIQKRVEQLIHIGDGGIDSRYDPAPFGLILFGAQLREEQVQRMERLPQVMARRCQKARFGQIGLLKLVIEASQFLGHPVDVGRQSTQLVAIVDVEAPGKVAGGNLAELSFYHRDRADQRTRNGVAKDDGQQNAAEREAHHDPTRRVVSLIARFDAGNHVGLCLVDQLVGEAFEPVGQRCRLCHLQFARFRRTAGTDQLDDLPDDAGELVVVLPKAIEQIDFIFGHELQSIDVIPKLIELAQRARQARVIRRQQDR